MRLNILSTWLKKADDYKKAYETQGFGPQTKRMKKANFEDVWDSHCQGKMECNCKSYDGYKQKWLAFKIVQFEFWILLTIHEYWLT